MEKLSSPPWMRCDILIGPLTRLLQPLALCPMDPAWQCWARSALSLCGMSQEIVSPQQALVWAPHEGNRGLRLGRRTESVADKPAKPSPSLRNNFPSHLASQGASCLGWAAERIWVVVVRSAGTGSELSVSVLHPLARSSSPGLTPNSSWLRARDVINEEETRANGAWLKRSRGSACLVQTSSLFGVTSHGVPRDPTRAGGTEE